MSTDVLEAAAARQHAVRTAPLERYECMAQELDLHDAGIEGGREYSPEEVQIICTAAGKDVITDLNPLLAQLEVHREKREVANSDADVRDILAGNSRKREAANAKLEKAQAEHKRLMAELDAQDSHARMRSQVAEQARRWLLSNMPHGAKVESIELRAERAGLFPRRETLRTQAAEYRADVERWTGKLEKYCAAGSVIDARAAQANRENAERQLFLSQRYLTEAGNKLATVERRIREIDERLAAIKSEAMAAA